MAFIHHTTPHIILRTSDHHPGTITSEHIHVQMWYHEGLTTDFLLVTIAIISLIVWTHKIVEQRASLVDHRQCAVDILFSHHNFPIERYV